MVNPWAQYQCSVYNSEFLSYRLSFHRQSQRRQLAQRLSRRMVQRMTPRNDCTDVAHFTFILLKAAHSTCVYIQYQEMYLVFIVANDNFNICMAASWIPLIQTCTALALQQFEIAGGNLIFLQVKFVYFHYVRTKLVFILTCQIMSRQCSEYINCSNSITQILPFIS